MVTAHSLPERDHKTLSLLCWLERSLQLPVDCNGIWQHHEESGLKSLHVLKDRNFTELKIQSLSKRNMVIASKSPKGKELGKPWPSLVQESQPWVTCSLDCCVIIVV